MEYIEREALIAAYDAAIKGEPGRARKLIADAPAVDVVPVVRCKDCRWSRTNPKDDADVYYCELRTGRAYHSGDFCSYGERRGDG